MRADAGGGIGAAPPPAGIGSSPRRAVSAGGAVAPVRDADGRVADGRDGWLSRIAFHAVSDAVARGEPLEPATLATTVWERFAATSDLSRPRKGGAASYTYAHAARKVADKLRLRAEGRLASREPPAVEAEYLAPTLSAGEARQELNRLLRNACGDIETWYADPEDRESPCIGIRATVGLGKSRLARRHLTLLRDRLIAVGAPSRIAVFAPSHALAEEVAAGWRAHGMRVAVLRGYEARHPVLRKPMCRDIEAVRTAVKAGIDIHSAACSGTGGRRCTLIDSCLKQRNRIEVEAADVVIAAYDALYSGFAIDPATLGLLLIDEGCWQRAEDRTAGTWEASVPQEIMRGRHGRRQEERLVEDAADLLDLRGRALAAFTANRPGALRTDALRQAGLTEVDCLAAVRLEERALRDPGLYPGMPAEERATATVQAEANERARFRAEVWRAMAGQLAGYSVGRLRVLTSAGGAVRIEVAGVKAIHPNFRGKPILHLDATLRPDLARTVLPRLTVSKVDAAAPHMSLRLVTGPFGKSSLCSDARAGADENQRRANRLAECVTYVDWQAKRAAGGVLVVTYRDCEAAFLGNPDVAVAHFNALAGLDVYRDVAVLIVIGRPLPREHRPRRALRRVLRARVDRRLPQDPSGRAHARRLEPDGTGARARGCRGGTAAGGDLRRRADPGDRPRSGRQSYREEFAGGARAGERRPPAGARSAADMGHGRARLRPANAARGRRGGQPGRCGTAASCALLRREAGAEGVRARRI